MRLKKLRLQSYRLHTDSTLDLGDATFVVVRGANGSGKSSLGQGFSMNVTPSTIGLNVKGDGYTSKIKQGESKAVITAEIQGKYLLRNTVTLNTNTSGRTVNTECLNAPDEKTETAVVAGFSNFMRDKKTALLIACNTEFYGKLSEKDQTDVIAKLVLPPRHDFPKDRIEATETYLGAGIIDFNGNPFDVITKGYKLAFDRRADANREVKNLVIPDALPTPKDNQGKPVDSASLQTQVDAIREQRNTLQAKRDAAVQKANETEVNRGKLQTKIEGLRAEVEKGKARLTAIQANVLDEDGLKALQAVSAKAEKLKEINEKHSVLLQSIRTANNEIERLNEVAEAGSTCPTCDQPIDSVKIAALVEEYKKEIADEDKNIQNLDTQIEALGDVGSALDAIQKHENAGVEIREIEASLTITVAIGKETRKLLDALGEKVDATAPFTQPLAELETKITTIMEQLRPVIAAEERKNDIATKTKELDKLQKKAAGLDSLVKYFDKDGVKSELISSYVGSFESKILSVLDVFGYKASLSMDPMEFNVVTSRGYNGPIKELSKAERQLFWPALQCAVSIAAGINMVVIDDMDTYLKETGLRNKMYSAIYQLIAEGELEQAIMIEASADKTLPEANKRAPGSRYFYVSEGTVEELK